MKPLLATLRNKKRALKENFDIWLTNRLVAMAAFGARRILNKNRPIRILLDNSVWRHGETHTNAWVDTGEFLWGGVIPQPTGYLARVPKAYKESEKAIYEDEIPYFAPLAYLAEQGFLRFFTSDSLCEERMRQPSYNRYIFGMNLWDKISIDCLPSLPTRGGGSEIITSAWYSASAQTYRVLSDADPVFIELTKGIPKKQILDFFHIWEGIHGDCQVFLTTDFSLKRIIQNNLSTKQRAFMKGLRVLTPSEFARELGIKPVPHFLLDKLDAHGNFV